MASKFHAQSKCRDRTQFSDGTHTFSGPDLSVSCTNESSIQVENTVLSQPETEHDPCDIWAELLMRAWCYECLRHILLQRQIHLQLQVSIACSFAVWLQACLSACRCLQTASTAFSSWLIFSSAHCSWLQTNFQCVVYHILLKVSMLIMLSSQCSCLLYTNARLSMLNHALLSECQRYHVLKAVSLLTHTQLQLALQFQYQLTPKSSNYCVTLQYIRHCNFSTDWHSNTIGTDFSTVWHSCTIHNAVWFLCDRNWHCNEYFLTLKYNRHCKLSTVWHWSTIGTARSVVSDIQIQLTLQIQLWRSL
jgi:hypothetical protein